jgi:hypothetical protein
MSKGFLCGHFLFLKITRPESESLEAEEAGPDEQVHERADAGTCQCKHTVKRTNVTVNVHNAKLVLIVMPGSLARCLSNSSSAESAAVAQHIKKHASQSRVPQSYAR